MDLQDVFRAIYHGLIIYFNNDVTITEEPFEGGIETKIRIPQVDFISRALGQEFIDVGSATKEQVDKALDAVKQEGFDVNDKAYPNKDLAFGYIGRGRGRSRVTRRRTKRRI
jgi:hypothetical protein